jgi:transcription elongation GreA/GreB family factor
VACMCGRQGALTCGGACGSSGESSLLGAVEKATAEAEKHGDRSEKLSALVAEAKGMIEQAKTKQAERAKAAAAVTAAAEAAEAAQRLHDEEELAALTLRVQQVQARLGSSVVPPADAEETMCVVCFDAPKDHILVPCYHLCVCEACANLLTQMDKPTCPICRAAIRQTNKVFQS